MIASKMNSMKLPVAVMRFNWPYFNCDYALFFLIEYFDTGQLPFHYF